MCDVGATDRCPCRKTFGVDGRFHWVHTFNHTRSLTQLCDVIMLALVIIFRVN